MVGKVYKTRGGNRFEIIAENTYKYLTKVLTDGDRPETITKELFNGFVRIGHYTEEEFNMKLEIGKKYVCRNTPRVKYVHAVNTWKDGAFYCFVHFKDDNRRPVQTASFESDGSWNSDGIEHAHDLVAEYVEPGEMGQVAYFGYIDEPGHVWKCECGAEKVGHKTHSTWCMKHED